MKIPACPEDCNRGRRPTLDNNPVVSKKIFVPRSDPSGIIGWLVPCWIANSCLQRIEKVLGRDFVTITWFTNLQARVPLTRSLTTYIRYILPVCAATMCSSATFGPKSFHTSVLYIYMYPRPQSLHYVIVRSSEILYEKDRLFSNIFS